MLQQGLTQMSTTLNKMQQNNPVDANQLAELEAAYSIYFSHSYGIYHLFFNELQKLQWYEKERDTNNNSSDYCP